MSERAPPGDLQDRRIRKTKRAIRQALESLLREQDIQQITAKDIAAEADIGYTTFFRHFATKEAALADLADIEAAALIEESFPLLRSDDSLTSCLAMCRHVESKRGVWSALLTGGAASLVREALIRHTIEKSDEWPAAHAWLPAESGTILVIGLVVEVLDWWLSHAGHLEPVEVAGIMDRLFISALTSAA